MISLGHFHHKHPVLCFQPTIQDPLQRKNIYIKTGPFGDSLFAKRDISRGDLVAYLNGFWYEKDEINWSNMTISEQYVHILNSTKITYY